MYFTKRRRGAMVTVKIGKKQIIKTIKRAIIKIPTTIARGETRTMIKAEINEHLFAVRGNSLSAISHLNT